MIVHHSLLISQIAIRITFIQNLNFCHFYPLSLVLYSEAISSFLWYCFRWLKKVIVLHLTLSRIQCFSPFYCSLYNCFFRFETKIIVFQLQALEVVLLGLDPSSGIYYLCNLRQVVQRSSVCFFICKMGLEIILPNRFHGN